MLEAFTRPQQEKFGVEMCHNCQDNTNISVPIFNNVDTVYYENCNVLSSGLEIDFSARTAKRY